MRSSNASMKLNRFICDESSECDQRSMQSTRYATDRTASERCSHRTARKNQAVTGSLSGNAEISELNAII